MKDKSILQIAIELSKSFRVKSKDWNRKFKTPMLSSTIRSRELSSRKTLIKSN